MGKQVIDHAEIKPAVRTGRPKSAEPIPRATMQPCPYGCGPCVAYHKRYNKTYRRCDGWQFEGLPFINGCGHTWSHFSHVLQKTNWKAWAQEQFDKLSKLGQ